MSDSKIVGRFRFDLLEDKCFWLKDNGKEFEVPKEWSGSGKIAYQKWFQLEGDINQSHWVNFSQTYSKGKVWVNVWYKKVELDGTRNDYFKRVERAGDICEISLEEKDEMVKVFDSKKNKDKWIKKMPDNNQVRI